MTTTARKPAYVTAIIRYRTGRKIVRELLADHGVVAELVDGRLKVWCAKAGGNEKFCKTPRIAFRQIQKHRAVVIEYLHDRNRSIDRWLRVLAAHREDFREQENDQDE